MPSSESERVTCPSCGKGYRWQSKLIGRRVTCKQCGDEFEVPIAPGAGLAIRPEPEPAADDGTYELDLDAAEKPAAQTNKTTAASNGGKCPQCNSPVREGAVLCMNCGYNLKEGKKIQTAVTATPAQPTDDAQAGTLTRRMQRDMETAADTHRQYIFEEYKLPIILLCIGFVFVLINAFGLTPALNDMYNKQGYGFMLSNTEAMIGYIIAFALTLVMMLPLMIGGIFGMAALFGSAFGNLFTAMLKLLALTVFVVGLDHMVDLLMDLATGGFGFIGWGVRLSVVLAAFYPICTKLFDMESHEIWVMFLLYVIGPIAIGMLALIIANSFI